MIYVYNKKGLTDTLLCMISANNGWKDDTIAKAVTEDIHVLKQNEQIVGVNILNASKKFALSFSGVLIEEDADLDAAVRKMLAENNVELYDETLKQKYTVGYIEKLSEHPDSNKLSVCQVNVGKASLVQIVCGAANVAQGQYVPVAEVGTVMPSGLVISPSTLRGVESNGMICSAKELNLPVSYHAPGIMVLEPTEVGQNFFKYFAELN